ncbi:MAG: 2-amino-4-hydroxy-6-hydroxymethyldihydropteridine diphosphokinase [Chitinophagaceae bacterium]
MNQHLVYLLLGSNMGDRENMLQQAATALASENVNIQRKSGLYETAAWGITDQPAFLNQVLEVTTLHNAETLMQVLLQIEAGLGRTRKERYGPRSIDIDILFFDDAIYHSANVTVPHPALQDRKFVLEPLCELAPDLVHPVYQQTVLTLLEQCNDKLPVKRIQ